MSTLAKKLQIKPGKSWLFFNAPSNYLISLDPLPDGVKTSFEPEGMFEGVQLFVKNSHELAGSLKVIIPVLKPDAVFWITYPKKSSGIESDLIMMGNWDEPAKYDLGIVTSVSVNETWTALRFKQERTSRISDTCNDNIRENDYSAYIDVDNKIVRLPDEIKSTLEKSAKALANYESLSYSNRKEYVLWVLTAKQEKTREERLVKLLEKLEAGKKNPSEK